MVLGRVNIWHKIKNKKITPFQEMMLNAAKTVKGLKLSCEANIVSIFFCKPDLMYDYTLKLDDLLRILGKCIGK